MKRETPVLEMMQAAVVREFGRPLVLEEMTVPNPGPGEILVRIEATGACHTDLHAAKGDWPVKPRPPFLPGHEWIGHVAALRAGVRGVKEDDRVGIPWLRTACGACSYCRAGWETLCALQTNTGYSVNGSFAGYALADPGFVGHLPGKLEFGAAAPVLCAGVTVHKGLKETEVRPGEWAVISSIGGLGGMAVQYARAMGMHVAAVDIWTVTPIRPTNCRRRLAVRTASWSPPSRRRASSRLSGCCDRREPWPWWACRPAALRCRSSRRC